MSDYPRKAYLKVEVAGEVHRRDPCCRHEPANKRLVITLPGNADYRIGVNGMVDTMEVDPAEVRGNIEPSTFPRSVVCANCGSPSVVFHGDMQIYFPSGLPDGPRCKACWLRWLREEEKATRSTEGKTMNTTGDTERALDALAVAMRLLEVKS